MTVQKAERSEEIDATRAGCFEVLLDFDTYPDWQPALKTAVVHERDAEGRGSLVEFTADAVVKQIGYIARYHYDVPARMRWELVSGTIKSGDGEFVLEELGGPERTLATYRLESDLGFYVPGPMLRIGTDKLMGGVIGGLKRRAEGH